MKKKVCFLGVLAFLVPGCWYSRNDQGQSTVLAPELVPLAIGVAAYKETQEIELNLELITSRHCVRVTPLGSFRLRLTKLDGTPEVLVEQFVSARTQQIAHPRLERGRYEVRVFHQDQTQKMVKKNITINEKNPLVLVDVPCLD